MFEAIFFSAGFAVGIAVMCLFLWKALRFSTATEAAKREAATSTLSAELAARDRHVQELTQTVSSREEQIARYQSESTEHQKQLAQLATQLDAQKQASEEKLKLLTEAQASLLSSFKALSSDALKSNNQSFLDLAKETLEKYQSTAKHDLEKRQQAIGELVKPLGDSLAKVDEKIAALEKERLTAYPLVLKIVLDHLHRGVYDTYLKLADIIIPFALDLRGMETSLFEVLKEHATVILPESEATPYRAPTKLAESSLARFKEALASHLEGKAIANVEKPLSLDASIRGRAALTEDEMATEILHWMAETGGHLDNTAILSPDYDAYAGAFYRLCTKLGIALNLSQGLSASEFGFLSETMDAQSEIWSKCRFDGKPDELMSRTKGYFSELECDTPEFENFRNAAVNLIDGYEAARKASNVKRIPPEHAWDYLSSQIPSVRLSNRMLGLDSQGLFYGSPADFLGVFTDNLAVIGLQDHSYPPRALPDAILSDEERASLNAAVSLRPSLTQRRM